MNLHYREFGQGQPLIILHGLFGMSDNWVSLGRQLSDRYRVLIPDLRNHGLSPHHPLHSYPAMADDLAAFMEEHQLVKPVLIGHSMGGKAAMLLACSHPGLISKLMVIDISPKAYDLRHRHLEVLHAMMELDVTTLSSRREAEERISSNDLDPGLVQMVLKNLHREAHGPFAWKINLKAIDDNLDLIAAAVDLPGSFTGPVMVVRGGRSDYIDMDDLLIFKKFFPLASFRTISRAGHWVHTDAAEELLLLIKEFAG